MKHITIKQNYTMVGSDYSAQEPRLLAAYSKDKFFNDQLAAGKDPYATIAVGVYHNKYEDNLEHYPDGSFYMDGKARRSAVKGLLLGIMYGMGTPAIAERLKVSIEEADKILNDFFTGFPTIKQWMDQSVEDARANGFVEDLWGRRRHLPDVNLPKYTITPPAISDFNPLLGSSGVTGINTDLVAKYEEKLSKAKYQKDIKAIEAEAEKENVKIRNNGGFIARAERQCVNARIQGGAASMTKRAMKLLYNDPEMRRMGFRLLIAVHDELIGECPEEFSKEVSDRLSYLMSQAGLPDVTVRMKCDADCFSSWYLDVVTGDVKKNYHKLIDEKGFSQEDAIKKIYSDYEELLPSQIDQMLAE